MTKKIIYEDVPEFNQATQYIIQLPPIETDNEIFYGIEILDLQIDEEGDDYLGYE